jgi:glutamine cyclotransferase
MFVLAGCGDSQDSADTTPTTRVSTTTLPSQDTTGPPAAPTTQVNLTVEVLNTYPHDTNAFTQGLVWNGDGELLESTGLRGESSLRRVELETGTVVQQHDVDARYFAEGLERVGDRLIQLTWQSQTALVYDATTFEEISTFSYTTEGWGLCQLDDATLAMTDGTSTLTLRNPDTFEVLRQVAVTDTAGAVDQLNELECVDGQVYANVWTTDRIVRIDPTTGQITGSVDASGLLTGDERAAADVLNGIAYRTDTETFLITGKRWPTIFEVRFVEDG